MQERRQVVKEFLRILNEVDSEEGMELKMVLKNGTTLKVVVAITDDDESDPKPLLSLVESS